MARRIFLGIVLLILLCYPVLSYQLYLEFDAELKITKAVVFEENAFYRDEYYSAGGDSLGIPVQLYSDSKLVASKQLRKPASVIFPIDDATKDYYVVAGDVIFSEPVKQAISFCNSNNVCEPCLSGYCTLIENHAVCTDCMSGGEDAYCDLKKDNVCDPDCHDRDPDCDCTDTLCYTGTVDYVRCSVLGGRACNIYQVCAGRNVYSDDYGTKCCIGNCIDLYESQDEELLKDVRKQLEQEKEEAMEQPADEQEPEEEEKLSFVEGAQEIDNTNVILVFLLIFSVGVLIIGGTYYMHKEHEVHFNNPIVRYVDSMVSKGYTKEQILTYMAQQGHKQQDIKQIFRMLKK